MTGSGVRGKRKSQRISASSLGIREGGVLVNSVRETSVWEDD